MLRVHYILLVCTWFEKNDYLWTSVTLLWPHQIVLYIVFKVDFIDIEMNTYNLDIEKLENFLPKKIKNYYLKLLFLWFRN